MLVTAEQPTSFFLAPIANVAQPKCILFLSLVLLELDTDGLAFFRILQLRSVFEAVVELVKKIEHEDRVLVHKAFHHLASFFRSLIILIKEA